MEGIETLAIFEEKISMTPRDLANSKLNIHALLLSKLAEKIEGKCSLHGWVMPHSTKILSRSLGYLESGRFTGDLVFHVQAQASVLNPPSGSHLVCDVVGNNMMGMYVSYKVRMRIQDKKTKEFTVSEVDAIKCILPRDLHIGDEAFSKVEIGDKVHVEVKKSRFQVNDKYILSVGIFEGKVDSSYVPPKVLEQEEEVVVEEGPSKVAAVRMAEFERDEAARLKAEEEARKKQQEEMAAKVLARVAREVEAEQRARGENELPPLATIENVVEPVAAPRTQFRGYRGATFEPGIPYADGEPILFNGTKIQDFKEFDNRFLAKFTLDGKEWPSVEHYYQAMKFPELPEFQEQIRVAPTAAAASKLGKAKDPSKPIRADWNEQREAIMRRAVNAKFDQNPALKEKLLNTHPRPLVFADANDAFYGYGRTQMGQNKLGQMLMMYRATYTGMEALNG
jgi:ribA/ribD-fused uncharacterized protein